MLAKSLYYFYTIYISSSMLDNYFKYVITVCSNIIFIFYYQKEEKRIFIAHLCEFNIGSTEHP